MEIHAPEKPIHSFKDFLVHLLTVTIGILIALSLEGLLEWRHHRELVHEARTNIVAEIRDNWRELSGSLAVAGTNADGHRTVLRFLDDMLRRGKSDIKELQLKFNLAQVNDTSWKTAQAVGALALMPYAEVKRYAAAYELQAEYQRLQGQTLDAVSVESGLFSNGDPHALSRPDLERAQASVSSGLARLNAQAQIGKALLNTYDETLKHGHEK